jgi:hypothetical protein
MKRSHSLDKHSKCSYHWTQNDSNRRRDRGQPRAESLHTSWSSSPWRPQVLPRTRVNKFGEFYQNSMDSVSTEFQNRWFTVHGFEIFEKKICKKSRMNFEQTGEDIFQKKTSFSFLNFKFTQIFLMGQNGFFKNGWIIGECGQIIGECGQIID